MTAGDIRARRRARARRRRLTALVALLAVVGGAAGLAVGRHHGGRTTSPRTREHVSEESKSLASPVAQDTSKPVPILMYHVLADPPLGAPYPELFVPPSDFAGEMRWLELHRYHAVTLDAVWKAWHHHGVLPRHPIVISFDDGYRSDVGVALPVLRQHRWPGVLNLALHNLGPGGLRLRGVRRLLAAGWEVDAHSLTHPDLTTVDDAQLAHEVSGSRTRIHHLFHLPVDFFCYPAGRYDERVVAAVRRAGFFGATTTEYGLARPREPYSLDRIRISGDDGVPGFAHKLVSLSG